MMKYSSVKRRLIIMHHFGYKKVQGLPMYEKYFRLNHYYTIYTMSTAEVLNLLALREQLAKIDYEKNKQLLIYAVKNDRFMTD